MVEHVNNSHFAVCFLTCIAGTFSDEKPEKLKNIFSFNYRLR